MIATGVRAEFVGGLVLFVGGVVLLSGFRVGLMLVRPTRVSHIRLGGTTLPGASCEEERRTND